MNDFIVEEIKEGGLVGRVYYDEGHDCNPREWEEFSTMVCWHRNYNLGDEQPNLTPDEYRIGMINHKEGGDQDIERRISNLYKRYAESNFNLDNDNKEHWEEYYKVRESLIEETLERYYIMLPLYLYDHSGISMNTSGFSCNWDSGQVGFIYVSKDDVRKAYKRKHVTMKLASEVVERLEYDVKLYDMYLTNQVFHFVIETEDGEWLDGCGGYLGEESVMDELKGAMDYIIKYRRKQRFDKLKELIRHKVTLNLRENLLCI